MNLQTKPGDKEHISVILEAIRSKDPSIWNGWKSRLRDNNSGKRVNLNGIDLRGLVLHGFDFQFTDLQYADLRNCKLTTRFDFADLTHAKLDGAMLWQSIFEETNISHASMTCCDFRKSRMQACYFFHCDLTGANFSDCDLEDTRFTDCTLDKAIFAQAFLLQSKFEGSRMSGASFFNANVKRSNFKKTKIHYSDFTSATLNGVDFSEAEIRDCKIYGISAWSLKGVPKEQTNLVITPAGEPEITVDDLQVAQFVYLLYHNPNIRNVISIMGKKSVLVLGRFNPPERKAVLEAIKQKLRENGFLPILFDFEKAPERDLIETVQILAGLSRFVVADLTFPKSIPLELKATVPNFMIPFVPIIQEPEEPFSMFHDLQKQFEQRLLIPIAFQDLKELLAKFKKAIIDRAMEAESALQFNKAKDTIKTINLKDL